MKKTKSTFQQLHEANLKIKELEKQIELLKNQSSANKCDCTYLEHIVLENQFPYGDTVTYDLCKKCNKQYDFKVL